jgi:RNA polymerase sigma-70 factor (ECF subfamily)
MSERNTVDDDAGLVALSQQGDLKAFEQLVQKYQKRMFNLAFRIAGDQEDAAEIVQDAFVAAFRSIGKFRGASRFTTWLTTITINHARNRLKQVRARLVHEVNSLDDPIEREDGSIMADPPSKAVSVLDQLEQRDLRKKVQECIAALEPDFREVIVLRDLQEFSYDEIGMMLKVAAGTVKSRLFRARDSVKDCLKKAFGSGAAQGVHNGP